MDRAVLVEVVDDSQAGGLPLLQPNERGGNGAIYADRATELAVDPHRLARDAERNIVAGDSGEGCSDT
jgi:hypothetical protein